MWTTFQQEDFLFYDALPQYSSLKISGQGKIEPFQSIVNVAFVSREKAVLDHLFSMLTCECSWNSYSFQWTVLYSELQTDVYWAIIVEITTHNTQESLK